MSWDIFSKSKIQYFLEKLKGKFVQKETGKGLSTNDYDNTDKAKVDKIDETTTPISGNPISISGLKSNQLAINPIITFEPTQDLHGQSKPYPAGGGKNLYSGTNVTISSALYSVVTLDKPIPAGTYTVSAKLSSELTTGAGVSFRKADNSAINRVDISYVAGGRGYGTLTISEDAYKLYFYYSNTTSGTGTRTWSDIQIESGSQPTAYAPYENICPISGYDKIEVLSGGKNLFDIDKVIRNSTISVSGNSISKAQSAYYGDLFSGNFGQGQPSAKKLYLPKGTYAVSYTASTSTNLFIDLIDDSTMTPTFEVNFNASSGSFTMPRNGYVCIKIASNLANTISNLQIESGSTATTYSPYVKPTSISESLGQTVYGGTLDVRTGKFTVTHKMVDMGNLTWAFSITTGGVNIFVETSTSDMKATANTHPFICECYDSVVARGTNYTISRYNIYDENARIYVNDNRYSADATGANDLKTALSGIKLVYELADSAKFTIQLTPHEISLLKDYAYVSTNGTIIALDYHNGELASLADVAQLSETVERLTEYIKGLINNA